MFWRKSQKVDQQLKVGEEVQVLYIFKRLMMYKWQVASGMIALGDPKETPKFDPSLSVSIQMVALTKFSFSDTYLLFIIMT